MSFTPGSPDSSSSDAHDLALAGRMRAGDQLALRDLLHRHAEGMRGVALFVTGRVDMAEEAVQLVFARSWERRDVFPDSGSIKGYLYKAARNQALNLVRHERAEERLQSAVAQEYTINARMSYNEGEARIAAEEFQATVTHALSAVQPQAREIFLMHRVQGMSYDEIATVLEVSVVTVRSQMSRAVRKLAEAFRAGL